MEEYKIIGKSKNFLEIIQIAEKIKKSVVPVFIVGESGAGKEILARHIHNCSERRNSNFVALNCASIPEQLLENELFGHKKGAFTDAEDDYPGKLGFADRGTLFLDEIGEMSLSIQAKLLRVIQFKEYEPIGSIKPNTSDVRFIASASNNISKLFKEKKIRNDLYYRLNVITLTIPPLRDRKEDIGLIAFYYLDYYNKIYNKNIKGFTKETLELFNKYSWPGNVRELKNAVERSVLLSDEKTAVLEVFLEFEPAVKNDLLLKDAINDFKKEYITEALERNGWNQTKTAAALDIQRTYLSRLINELKINKI